MVLASATGAAAAVLTLLAGPSAREYLISDGFGGSAGLGSSRSDGQVTGETRTKSKIGFTVGDVPGEQTSLYPGASQSRRVRLTNPNNFAIRVTSLAAAPAAPVDAQNRAVAGCAAGNLTVLPLGQPVTVPRNGSADVALTVRMSGQAPDACKNVRFPLTYSGTASKP